MASPRPVRVRRAAAALIDAALAFTIALVPAAFTPGVAKARVFGVGLLLGAAYLLLRDAIPYAEWGARSLGKRVIGIRPYRVGAVPMSLGTSLRRNATVAAAVGVPALMYLAGGYALIPFGDWIVRLCVLLVAAETLLIAVDPLGRRLGDRWASTRVIEARADVGVHRPATA